MLTRRNVAVLILAGGLAAAGLYIWQQLAAQPARANRLRQHVIGTGTILATVTATGHLAAQDQRSLYFGAAAPGTVVELGVVLGDQVQAGQILARLDDRELALAVEDAEQALRAAKLRLALLTAPARLEDLAVAEANVAVARNQVFAASQGQAPEAVEIARLNLIMAQNALDQTYAEMDRLVAQGRFGDKAALQAQADRQIEEARIADLRYHQAQDAPAFGPIAAAQAGLEQAEAALQRLKTGPAEQEVRIAELEVEQALAALESARHDLLGATLSAPFDGVVAATNLGVGQPPAAALPAIVLVDVSRYYLDVAVDEVDVARVAAGQPVTVTFDALPKHSLTAVVDRIAPSATINEAGEVSYAVRLALAAADAPLRGGMTATAAIVVEDVQDVVVVPNWAVRRERATGAAFASVLRDGELIEVPVVLGLRDESVSQVLAGLEAGEIVAVPVARDRFGLFEVDE